LLNVKISARTDPVLYGINEQHFPLKISGIIFLFCLLAPKFFLRACVYCNNSSTSNCIQKGVLDENTYSIELALVCVMYHRSSLSRPRDAIYSELNLQTNASFSTNKNTQI
jgi:hypothetical protein